MSDYSLLLDVAKARQAELLQEVEKTRIRREFKAGRKAFTVRKRLQNFLSR
jgi:hypothetical protein